MKRQVPVALVIAVALVIVVVVGYMALVRPERAESGRLDEEIATLETQLAAALRASTPEPGAQVKIADLFELAKAMPDDTDMPGIMLELDAVARSSGVAFSAIAPQLPVAATAHRSHPITLTFVGNYLNLVDFIYRLRNLVLVRDGRLDAEGRFFSLDTIDLHMSPEGWPVVEAVLSVSAYVFVDAAPATAQEASG